MTKTDSIALIEVGSIAQGYAVADALVKAAEVTLLEVAPVTPGKLTILYTGSVAALGIAHRSGLSMAGEDRIDDLFLPLCHPRLLEVLNRPGGPIGDALGILELGTVSSGLLAADAAAKATGVTLHELHAARGIGGKATLLMTGTVGDVETSLAAGVDRLEGRNTVLRNVRIASIHEDLAAVLADRWKAGKS